MKISKSLVGEELFKLLRLYIFDDFETVEGGSYKHDESHVTLIAEVDEEYAKHILDKIGSKGYTLPDGMNLLVGNWMVETTSSYSNGVYWYTVDELVRCHQVTETKIVTSWKPL